MGFDISKCGGKTDCESIVKKLSDSCDANSFMDDAAAAMCKDDYIGKFHPYSVADPVYSKAPISAEEHKKLSEWQNAEPAAPAAEGPAARQGWGDFAGAEEPVGEPAAAAAAVAPVAVPAAGAKPYDPKSDQDEYVTFSGGAVLIAAKKLSGGTIYKEDSQYDGDNDNKQRTTNFGWWGMYAGLDFWFSHFIHAKNVAERIANGETVTHDEFLTPWRFAVGFEWKGLFFDGVAREDTSSGQSKTEGKGMGNTLMLNVKGEYKVNPYVSIGAGVGYGNFFSNDKMSINIDQGKKYAFMGAGDSDYVHAIEVGANMRIEPTDGFSMNLGLRYDHLMTYGATCYNGDSCELKGDMFLVTLGLSLGLGNPYMSQMPGAAVGRPDLDTTPTDRSQLNWYSATEACAFVVAPEWTARWSQDAEKYKAAVKANPGDVPAQFELGMAYIKLGDREAAEKQIEVLGKIDAEKAMELAEELGKPNELMQRNDMLKAGRCDDDAPKSNAVSGAAGAAPAEEAKSEEVSTGEESVGGSTDDAAPTGWGDL